MTDLESDLRTTTENVLMDAERLAEIEAEKTALPVDDPRMVELSEEAARLAKAIVPKTAAELALSEEVAQAS